MSKNTNVKELQTILEQACRNLAHYEGRLDELLWQKEKGKHLPSRRIEQEKDSICKYKEIIKDLELRISIANTSEGK